MPSTPASRRTATSGTRLSRARLTTIRAFDSTGLEFDVDRYGSGLKSSTYKNHGQYVKAMGGGDDAAHSCIGMPINSNQYSRPTAD